MKRLSPDWRPIIWSVIPLYLLANIYLIFIGESISTLLLLFGMSLFLSVLAWFTLRETEPLPPEEEPTGQKSKPWIQLGVVLLVILLTGLSHFNIPLWSGMAAWFFELGERILPVEWFGGPGNALANPVQYFVIPFILLLLLGARPAELGFGRGNKVWNACLVWLAIPVLTWLILLVTGMLPLQVLLRRIIANTFQNGFFEEFLFRGALQTRLRYLLSTPWALTIQALAFGLWHLRANTQMMDGNILAGLAFCIISQSVAGFVFGLVYHRTRNLIVPSIAHVAMNVFGQTF